MDSIRPNKNRKQKKSKTIPWKVLPYIDTNSDNDSDGTTGSVGAERLQSDWSSTTNDFDKPIIETSPIFAEEPPSKPSTESSEKKSSKREKKRNNRHKKNEALQSMLNVVILGVLLIATGMASNQYYRNKKLQDFTRNPQPVFHQYVNRLTDAYKKLSIENMELRNYIQTLEASTDCNNKHHDSEDDYCENIEEIMKSFEEFLFDQSNETKNECDNKETQINSNDGEVEVQEIIETLTSNDYVIANCDEDDQKDVDETNETKTSKRNKSGYVSNIRKLFEPPREDEPNAEQNETEPEPETALIDPSTFIGPVNDPNLENKSENTPETNVEQDNDNNETDLFDMNWEKPEDSFYKPDYKSEIRESKHKTKLRENEGHHRIRRKTKNFQRIDNSTINL